MQVAHANNSKAILSKYDTAQEAIDMMTTDEFCQLDLNLSTFAKQSDWGHLCCMSSIRFDIAGKYLKDYREAVLVDITKLMEG